MRFFSRSSAHLRYCALGCDARNVHLDGELRRFVLGHIDEKSTVARISELDEIRLLVHSEVRRSFTHYDL